MATCQSWRPQPESAAALDRLLGDALTRCSAAASYAKFLRDQTAVRLRDIVDFVECGTAEFLEQFTRAGWSESEPGVWRNPRGLFPPILAGGRGLVINFRVDSVSEFLRATQLPTKIAGELNGPARKVTAFTADDISFVAYERNGYCGFDVPEASPASIRMARIHSQRLRARRRYFDNPREGIQFTEKIVSQAIADIGPNWTCSLWLRAEREYWAMRCSPGKWQQNRQRLAGIGWSNIDHHTYDGSRTHFRDTMRVLQRLGYERREMLYAGELAGWGSQVLEHPVIGSTIFADVDLGPHELNIDFSVEPLAPLEKRARAGIVTALHGESILEAGLNHVAGLYDHVLLRSQLQAAGFGVMPPFSSSRALHQELTEGEWAPVDPARVDALEREGSLKPAEAEEVRVAGAVLSHLENIERNYGYKGFNRRGIDSVLRKIDPRAAAKCTAAQI